MVSIGYSIIGRLSDIFGRRWFLICGSIFALVGDIVCATATNIPTIIGGTAIIGLAAAVQLSFLSMLGELTPIKHRFLVNAFMYVWIAVPAGFGPAISYAFVIHTAAGWRWCYYFLIIINAVSTALYYFFYYPPNFHMKQRNHTRWELIKKFDFAGLFLYTAGITLFLLGISWGGSVHPWKSASVIATTVIGGLTTVAFVFWELRHDLEEPLMPPRVLKHFGECLTLYSCRCHV
jgi:MFS family permease